MTHSSESVKVLSANCQGLRNYQKRSDILQYFRETNASIVCLQDTHLLKSDIPSVKQIWNYCYLHGTKTNSRGVAILLNNNFEHEVIEHNEDGKYLQLILRCSSIKINLINIYAQTNDEPHFLAK